MDAEVVDFYVCDLCGHYYQDTVVTECDCAPGATEFRHVRMAPVGANGAAMFAPQWPEGLEQEKAYEVRCDDKGRNGGSWLRVFVAGDGDAHVVMQDWEDMPEGQPSPIPGLRCRTHFGGGRNARTHQALLWLAQAIRLDNAEREGVAGHG